MQKKSPPRPAPRRPGNPDPAVPRMLGEALALLRAGQAARAGEICDAVLAIDPKQPDALHMGAAIALQQGRPERASERLEKLTKLQPQNGSALCDLGLAYHLAGRFAEAEAVLTRCLQLRRDFPEAWNNLGNALAGTGRDSEAADAYQRALALRPAFPEAHNNLALAQLRLGLPALSLEGAQRALALRPAMLEALQTLAAALDALGRPEEAIAVSQELIRRSPRPGAAYYALGSIQLHYGRLDAAAENFRKAIALEPGHGEWHRMLAQIVKHDARDVEIETMARLYQSGGTRQAERMHLSFGLGKALDDIGAYEEAFDYFLEGNRLKRARLSYASTDSDRLFADIKQAFTPDRLARNAAAGSPDKTPVFVLGMPRSGTSLVEQVIASHPAVRGGGEFTLLNRLVGSLGQGEGRFRFDDLLDRVGDSQLTELGQSYVAQLRALSSDARFITDKTPGNFLLIGMIKLLLPNATVIHCRRDAVDTSLSIFKTYFAAEGLRYAYDLAEIGHYHALYRDLMAHWHQALPGFVHDVSYEALVGDFDTEARALLAHCGLDWRDEVKEFFNTRRSVQTASSAQVRRPIYNSSIGLAARYGDRVAPLLRALNK
ncbi:MAG TPA: sulfotransferase [Devosiaceae bacterium]|nr:sulfotransferase [Devosiaceae bacterium]